jgi:hypothetical protein
MNGSPEQHERGIYSVPWPCVSDSTGLQTGV